MFIRKAQRYLEEWKARKQSKPLVLRGARQVGKSTLVQQFGQGYKHFVILNLEKAQDAGYFKGGDEVKVIFDKILLQHNLSFLPSETLLFIDEIQEVPAAIALLRYFYEDLPELDVIAAGSLLEFAIGDVPAFPVGRVEQLPIYPLDFEEFLTALGEIQALEYYKQMPIPTLAHDKLMSLFNTFIIIGGMPEIVASYLSSDRNISSLTKVYSSIWDNYIQDIEKYGNNPTERKVLRHIVATAPAVRDRITFGGFGNSAYKAREVGEAFRKLDKAGLIKLIYPTSHTKPPLIPNYRRKPKIQFLDTGLLNYAAGTQASMIDVKDLNAFHRGYLVNHMMIQELISQSDRLRYIPPFWTRENANANAEVDLVVDYKNLLIPIEVKSGAKGRLRSLHEYMDRTEHDIAVRLLANVMQIDEGVTRKRKTFTLLNLPYYAVSQLTGYLEYLGHIS